MPNKKTYPSIQSLQEEIRLLQQELDIKNNELDLKDSIIENLSIDPSYGILTRPAMHLEIKKVATQAKYLIFTDIDDLFVVNALLPRKTEEANEKIFRALHLRSEDVLLSGRWYSGDELVIILSGNPDAVCNRLKEAFEREQLSITCAWVEYTGNFAEDVLAAKSKVDALKPGTIEEKIIKRMNAKKGNRS